MRTALVLVFALALVISGCGSDARTLSTDTGEPDGPVTSVPVTSVASMTGPLSGRSGSIHGNVIISDLADTCGTLVEDRKNGAERASSTTTTLLFGLDARELSPGTYPINYRWGRSAPAAGRFACAAITTTDAACTHQLVTSTKGAISLEEVDEAGIKGTFSVTFEDGKVLDGAFDAPACPGYLETDPGSDAVQCVPRDE